MSCICSVNLNPLRIDFAVCLWLQKTDASDVKTMQKEKSNACYRGSVLLFPHDVVRPATPVRYCSRVFVLEIIVNLYCSAPIERFSTLRC